MPCSSDAMTGVFVNLAVIDYLIAINICFLHLDCHKFSSNKLSRNNCKFRNRLVVLIYNGSAFKSKSLANRLRAMPLKSSINLSKFSKSNFF